jgi:putative Holliday junction resolvase
MRSLALDVGTKKTGIAYLDDAVGIPLPLETCVHASQDALVARVKELIAERGIERVVVGLPLLPSGEEGAQASISRAVGSALSDVVEIVFADERYTTPRPSKHKHAISPQTYDGDMAAACSLLAQKGGIDK